MGELISQGIVLIDAERLRLEYARLIGASKPGTSLR